MGERRRRKSLSTRNIHILPRTVPYPSFITYDANSGEFCTVRRIRTSTPLQALTSLNDPAFFEAAQAMARCLTKEGGRDHHARAFSILLAEGGIKSGLTLGQTYELGCNIIEDPVHVHDLHARILHLMGLDHTKLTYRFHGRDFRLTDVHGNVVKKQLA